MKISCLNNMQQKIFACAQIFLLVLHISLAMPFSAQTNDIEDNFLQSSGGGQKQPVDYHTVVGHFKDFLMYLPVMMTTIKETMTGFPRFAEGVRILTSRTGRAADSDCKCKNTDSSNEIENSSRFG